MCIIVGAQTYVSANFSVHHGNRRFVASPSEWFLYVFRRQNFLLSLPLYHDHIVWFLGYPDDTCHRMLTCSEIPAKKRRKGLIQ